jgi:hypothetical protein
MRSSNLSGSRQEKLITVFSFSFFFSLLSFPLLKGDTAPNQNSPLAYSDEVVNWDKKEIGCIHVMVILDIQVCCTTNLWDWISSN